VIEEPVVFRLFDSAPRKLMRARVRAVLQSLANHRLGATESTSGIFLDLNIDDIEAQ
jgi:hypothetical protein